MPPPATIFSKSSKPAMAAAPSSSSQLPIGKWHELIGDPTYADAILDRLVHNAHRIELTGDSLRKRRKAEPAAASVAAVPRARS
jgi:DNA replication protein DnaC